MATTSDRRRPPNTALEHLIAAAGVSCEGLAHRVNTAAQAAGYSRTYTHTSVAGWTRRGVVPKAPTPAILAAVLSERLGRHITLDDIGMPGMREPAAGLGLDFPRDPAEALRAAATFWSTMDRRTFMSDSTAFTLSAFTTPAMRWAAVPADPGPARGGVPQVGTADVQELWLAAEEARRWDSRFGGGHWHSSAAAECLRQRAVPLLTGAFTERTGRELFTVTAELARVVGWCAFDAGQHAEAQRHFVQALRMARAAGNVEVGSYVLATMSLQAFLRGYPQEAADMAECAYERAAGHAAPRVLAFAKLAQARAHARAGDGRAASSALAASENLLDRARGGDNDPEWISYLTHERLAADATECFRDLGNPAAALRWNEQAEAMPAGVFTRAVGIRHCVVATTHLTAGELDQGLAVGQRALEVLARVESARARGYLQGVVAGLEPWRADPRVEAFKRDCTQLSR